MHLYGPVGLSDAHLYMIANASWDDATFELPSVEGLSWRRIVDTSLESPDDFSEPIAAAVLDDPTAYLVAARSTVVLLAAPGWSLEGIEPMPAEGETR
jgi:pullulanase/glycogen debranching enzyme